MPEIHVQTDVGLIRIPEHLQEGEMFDGWSVNVEGQRAKIQFLKPDPSPTPGQVGRVVSATVWGSRQTFLDFAKSLSELADRIRANEESE